MQGAFEVPVLKLDWLNWEGAGLGGRKEKAFGARRDCFLLGTSGKASGGGRLLPGC